MKGPIKLKQSALPLRQVQDPRNQQWVKKQSQKLQKASEMYEKLFLNEMVRAMRKTIPKGQGYLKQNFAEKIFQQKLDEEYVEAWGNLGGIGLGNLIYDQLKEKVLGRQTPLFNPKGPLQIKKNPSAIPIKSKDSVLPIEKNNQIFKKQSMNFEWKLDSETSVEELKVASPWNGKIANIVKNDGNGIHIRHDDGVESILYFKGDVSGLKSGEPIKAGQTLGFIDPGQRYLSWNVTKSVPGTS